MKFKTLVVNGVVAALYVALIAAIYPFAFLSTQFRIPEMLNHLVVFHRKYFWGIVLGVFLSNLFFSPIPLDMVFGVLHTVVALLCTMLTAKFVKSDIKRMVLNAFFFSIFMFIIAVEIALLSDATESILLLWGPLFLSEAIVMGVGVPVMHLVNKKLNLRAHLEEGSSFKPMKE